MQSELIIGMKGAYILENNRFTFRRYIEEIDAHILYTEYSKYCRSNIQPYFSSVGVGLKKEDFLSQFQKFSQKQYRPPIIAEAENNKPCGIYRLTYCGANHYYELMIHCWEKGFAKPALKQIIDEALHKDVPERRLLMKVPEYLAEIKDAAEGLGMELVGTIPNYICHDDTLQHLYIYVMAFER